MQKGVAVNNIARPRPMNAVRRYPGACMGPPWRGQIVRLPSLAYADRGRVEIRGQGVLGNAARGSCQSRVPRAIVCLGFWRRRSANMDPISDATLLTTSASRSVNRRGDVVWTLRIP